MYRLILWIVILAVLFIAPSCNSNQNEQSHLQRNVPSATIKPKLDCLDGRDTTFPNKDYMKLVTISDSAFDVKIGIEGREAFAGFRFTCKMPKGLIPKVLKHTSGQIILMRGFGFHFREVLICSSKAGTIHIQRFETAKAIGAKYDIAYPDANDSSRIIVTDLQTNRVVKLQMRQQVKSIKLFQISENAVTVVDDTGLELVLPFKS